MPTPIIQYQCCKCGKIYHNEKVAIECEEKHFELNDFKIQKIGENTSSNKNFPRIIYITTEKLKGRQAEYRYNSTALLKNKREQIKCTPFDEDEEDF